jgi:hypothetical protein
MRGNTVFVTITHLMEQKVDKTSFDEHREGFWEFKRRQFGGNRGYLTANWKGWDIAINVSEFICIDRFLCSSRSESHSPLAIFRILYRWFSPGPLLL